MSNEQKQYSSNWDDYKFSSEEKVGVMTVQKDITQSDVESVIVGAFEGGSHYWMAIDSKDEVWKQKPKGIPYSTWATQMLIEGKTIPLYDEENDNAVLLLTLEKLINGISLNASNRPWDSNIEDGDVTTYDCIIQFAVFDEVVYG